MKPGQNEAFTMKRIRIELGVVEVPGIKVMRNRDTDEVILMFDELDEKKSESKFVTVRLPASQAEAVYDGLGRALGKTAS